MYRKLLKPAFDLALGMVLSLVTFPLILILCLWIILESPGSPIFVQTRVGRNGRHFPLYKLRTMIKDAETAGPLHTQERDPRITRAGRTLRRFSLDELPQLWNIVLMQMSLIGPRPALPSQEFQYPAEFWRLRHSVRPGITGLAQATIRSSGTLEEQIELDRQYVSGLTPVMDLRILWRTAHIVISGSGSN